jgi:phosphoribosylaminoimidazole-succinocarboxamide synthase
MSTPFKYAPPVLTNLPLLHQGKTRDSFTLPRVGRRTRHVHLVVATDRVSTHNVVHKSSIPLKGEVLTFLTIFWLRDVLGAAGVKHHLIAWGKRIYDFLPGKQEDYPGDLHRRAIVVETLSMIPVEFIYRAYLAGSLWSDYYSKGLLNPYGVDLPKGLSLMTKFEDLEGFNRPIFTPTEKSETDPPLPSAETQQKYPQETQETSLGFRVYELGRRHLSSCGLELVDTKFEMGRDRRGVLKLGDEALTLDSSRFTQLSEIRLGLNPTWRDKQVARNTAEAVWAGGPKIPLVFPEELVADISRIYCEVLEQVTGASHGSWLNLVDG